MGKINEKGRLAKQIKSGNYLDQSFRFKLKKMTNEEIAEIYCELMDEEFYNLMNMYRIAPLTDQKYTQDRYNDVIKFLLKILWKYEKE